MLCTTRLDFDESRDAILVGNRQLEIHSVSKRHLFWTSCTGGRHNMPQPPASWPLTFWPWKWCPSHVWRGLPLC